MNLKKKKTNEQCERRMESGIKQGWGRREEKNDTIKSKLRQAPETEKKIRERTKEKWKQSGFITDCQGKQNFSQL